MYVHFLTIQYYDTNHKYHAWFKLTSIHPLNVSMILAIIILWYICLFLACGLSVKSVFSQPFNKRLEAYAQKLTWANYSCSDPIAFIAPYQVQINYIIWCLVNLLMNFILELASKKTRLWSKSTLWKNMGSWQLHTIISNSWITWLNWWRDI